MKIRYIFHGLLICIITLGNTICSMRFSAAARGVCKRSRGAAIQYTYIKQLKQFLARVKICQQHNMKMVKRVVKSEPACRVRKA